ncbi:MAG TPA: HAMP domain-containing sensor histidine kinase [Ktedonobacterales bacterium]|nr:HAMP domain-containing sensor histidine kinase [Ktedonobacterales bacterium]
MDTYRDNQPQLADDESAFVRFLDLAGHDLRNPITVLKSQVQLLQRRLSREEGRADDLRDLNRMAYQIERLNVGLDTFLEAARIRQGRFYLMPDTCDLTSIVRRLATTYASASRAHTVTFDVPNEPIMAKWDMTRVELALAELLTNALKFTAQGDVTIRVTREPPFARVTVTDTGPGVPPGEESDIFEENVTGSNMENAGIGLGLYVAREIVRQHGGDIGIITPPEGGASFWFTLPLAGTPGADPML